MKTAKKEVIVDILDGELTKEDRRNFKKNHPGRRLCFRLRFPYFPEYLACVAIAIFILNIFINVIYAIICRTA